MPGASPSWPQNIGQTSATLSTISLFFWTYVLQVSGGWKSNADAEMLQNGLLPALTQPSIVSHSKKNLGCTPFLRHQVNGCFHNTAATNFRKFRRWHFKREVYPRCVVRVDSLVGFGHQLA